MSRARDLATPRLRLRQWRDTDLAAFAALNADPEVMAYFPNVLERQASDAMAARCRRLIDERGWGFWAVELKSSGEFIGFIGLHVPADELPFSPCVEIGWRLASAHWGHGYASEGARAALRFGFGILGLDEIVSFTALCNTRSRAVMERIGMRYRGETFAHPALPDGHRLRSHCLYRLTRGEAGCERNPCGADAGS
jgi:RimJ/RimL family protein N-acetyltransferase